MATLSKRQVLNMDVTDVLAWALNIDLCCEDNSSKNFDQETLVVASNIIVSALGDYAIFIEVEKGRPSKVIPNSSKAINWLQTRRN